MREIQPTLELVEQLLRVTLVFYWLAVALQLSCAQKQTVTVGGRFLPIVQCTSNHNHPSLESSQQVERLDQNMAGGNQQSGVGKRKAAPPEITRRSLRRRGTGEDDVSDVDGTGEGGVNEEVAQAPRGEGERGGGEVPQQAERVLQHQFLRSIQETDRQPRRPRSQTQMNGKKGWRLRVREPTKSGSEPTPCKKSSRI